MSDEDLRVHINYLTRSLNHVRKLLSGLGPESNASPVSSCRVTWLSTTGEIYYLR